MVQSTTKDLYRAEETQVNGVKIFRLQVFLFRYWFFKWRTLWTDVYRIEYFENEDSSITDFKDWTFTGKSAQECFDYAVKYEKHFEDKKKEKIKKYHYQEDEKL